MTAVTITPAPVPVGERGAEVRPRRFRWPVSARYIALRLLGAIIAVWGAFTIVFFALQASGDPTRLLVPLDADQIQIDAARAQFGFDRPLIEQYFHFLGTVLTGQIPASFRSHVPALDLVFQRLGATAVLTLTGLGLGVLFGLVGGFFAATARTPLRRRLPLLIAIVVDALPPVILGITLVLVFAVTLRWLPSGGGGDLQHLILPAITLAALTAPTITRVYRASILAAAGDDHVRTARAKGVRESLVQVRHVGVNALVPVLNVIGIVTGALLGGAVVTETLFAWPGVGQLIVGAITARDFPVVLAGILVVATAFAIINLIVDIAAAFLDPRIAAS